MTDFNLEQFKAGRIAINHEGISGRYLGDLKDTDGNSIALMSVALSHPGRNRGHEWMHCFTPYGRSVNNSEEPFTKMKPKKKKLYIVVRHERDANFRRTTSPAYESREDAEETGFCTEPHIIVEVEVEV